MTALHGLHLSTNVLHVWYARTFAPTHTLMSFPTCGCSALCITWTGDTPHCSNRAYFRGILYARSHKLTAASCSVLTRPEIDLQLICLLYCGSIYVHCTRPLLKRPFSDCAPSIQWLCSVHSTHVLPSWRAFNVRLHCLCVCCIISLSIEAFMTSWCQLCPCSTSMSKILEICTTLSVLKYTRIVPLFMLGLQKGWHRTHMYARYMYPHVRVLGRIFIFY